MPAAAEMSRDEQLAIDLIQAIRADAEEACAPDEIELVSVTVDVSGSVEPGADIRLTARIDRKTRTILFTGGTAFAGDAAVMTATAVYRIKPQA